MTNRLDFIQEIDKLTSNYCWGKNEKFLYL